MSVDGQASWDVGTFLGRVMPKRCRLYIHTTDDWRVKRIVFIICSVRDVVAGYYITVIRTYSSVGEYFGYNSGENVRTPQLPTTVEYSRDVMHGSKNGPNTWGTVHLGCPRNWKRPFQNGNNDGEECVEMAFLASWWRHERKHFPRYWPFVRGIHRSPVNSPYKGQWRGALMFSLICTRTNDWLNNRDAGDLRRHRAHYDITAMLLKCSYGYRLYTWYRPLSEDHIIIVKMHPFTGILNSLAPGRFEQNFR